MKRRLLLAAIGLAPLLATAHHGWSEYDSTRLLKLSGRILESGYEHPHGFIRLEAAGERWLCVLAPPSRMENRGLPREALAPGANVAVEGYANREKRGEMRAERITAGGRTVELR
ncbi:MAG: hypothetical protein A3I63_09120 [Betaproteobacteria bacterium RIFCSPLOWO2_02_FULL_66_14]|nr:MAG: hypothetical protein A3I63_09120 [Betaproteobacteria bacterium RIFCSPLOWO2_02_FULL_66_14]